MQNPSDADLAESARRGDVDAVAQLYDRHHERIFRYTWSRTGNRQLAEDLTGETFVRMVRHLPNYRPRGVPFQAWLYRIARNLLTDHYRKESSRVSVPLHHAEGLSEDMNESDAIERQLTAERVQQALAQLARSQRQVVELRFLVGLSLKEVAGILGRSVAAIKSLQHRGLRTLRAELEYE